MESVTLEKAPLAPPATEPAELDEHVGLLAERADVVAAASAPACTCPAGFDAGDGASAPESGLRHVDSPLPL